MARVPVFLQSETAECGLACLAMVAASFNRDTDLHTLRMQFPGSIRGLTMGTLSRYAQKLGLLYRGLRAEPEHLDELRCPAILHWQMDHFVVLVGVRRKGCVIHDPAVGRRLCSWGEVDQKFTGVVLELWPGQSSPREGAATTPQKPRLSLSEVWSTLNRPAGSVLWVFALSLGLQLMLLAGPWHVQWTVDEALMSSDVHLVGVLGIGFAMLALFRVATNWLRSLVIMKLGYQMSFQLAGLLLGRLLKLPLPWFERRHLGDITSRFASLQPVRDFLVQGAAAILVDGLMVFMALVVMLVYSLQLGLLVLAVQLVLVGVHLLAVPYLRRLSLATIHAQAQEETQLIESVRQIQAIKVYAMESPRQGQWLRLHGNTIAAAIQQGTAQIRLATLTQTLTSLELVAVVYLAALLVLQQQFSLGMLFALVSYRGQVTERMRSLVDAMVHYKTLQVHFDRLGEIWCEPVEWSPENADEDLPNASHVANLSCVGLGYGFQQGQRWLIRNLQLEVSAGEFVAIVGPSGCGKTTLLKLLMGLIGPDEGQVLVGKQPLSQASGVLFRRQVACVMQDDVLFKGSVLQNLTLQCELDHDWLLQVLRLVDLEALVMSLPMGLATQIGDIGEQFSAGQKQRLLLARALYQRPNYLFMDEVTANLDQVSAKRIGQVIGGLACTRVLVTHDANLAAQADRLLQLQPAVQGATLIALKPQQLGVQGS